MKCDVLFSGTLEPKPVALKHLRRVVATPLNTAGMVLHVPVTVTGDSDSDSHLPTSTPQMSALHSCVARDARESPKSDEWRLGTDDVNSCISPFSQIAQEDEKRALDQVAAIDRLEKRLLACEAVFGDGVGTPQAALTYDAPSFAEWFDVSKDHAAHAQLLSKVAELKEAQRQMEERHLAETVRMQKALQDAIAYGQQQEARVASLEAQLRACTWSPSTGRGREGIHASLDGLAASSRSAHSNALRASSTPLSGVALVAHFPRPATPRSQRPFSPAGDRALELRAQPVCQSLRAESGLPWRDHGRAFALTPRGISAPLTWFPPGQSLLASGFPHGSGTMPFCDSLVLR